MRLLASSPPQRLIRTRFRGDAREGTLLLALLGSSSTNESEKEACNPRVGGDCVRSPLPRSVRSRRRPRQLASAPATLTTTTSVIPRICRMIRSHFAGVDVYPTP